MTCNGCGLESRERAAVVWLLGMCPPCLLREGQRWVDANGHSSEASSRGILMLLGRTEWSGSSSRHLNAFPCVTWTLKTAPPHPGPVKDWNCSLNWNPTGTHVWEIYQFTIFAILDTSSLSSRSREAVHWISCPLLCPAIRIYLGCLVSPLSSTSPS